jgi:hypothetical protein
MSVYGGVGRERLEENVTVIVPDVGTDTKDTGQSWNGRPTSGWTSSVPRRARRRTTRGEKSDGSVSAWCEHSMEESGPHETEKKTASCGPGVSSRTVTYADCVQLGGEKPTGLAPSKVEEMTTPSFATV